jgi:amino acid adenylation domain-containing protein
MRHTIIDPGARDAKLPVAGLSTLKRKLLEKYLNGESTNAAAPALISPRPPQASAPLSFAQQQVWLHTQMAGDIPFYNETITIYRVGPLNVEVLERCLLEIIRRHEIWRTTFDTVDGEPVQIVHPAPREFSLPMHDLRHLPEAECKAKAELWATEDARRPFDLREGPLLRGLVVRMEDDRYRLYMTVHQIVFDAVTAYHVFLPELAALYEAFSAGNPSPLGEVGVQYADFAYWQRTRQNVRPEHMAHWQQHLAGELPLLEWPNERPRPPLETHRGAIQRFSLPTRLVRALRTTSEQAGVSLYMTLLSGLIAILQRYTGQEDIILGSFSAGRNGSEFEGLPGYFVNPLALRFDLSGNPSFRELQLRVRGTVLDALAHEEVPFAEIVKNIQHRPDPSRNPLFQIVLSKQPKLPHIPEGWDLITEEISNGGSKVDLVIVIDERGESVSGPITYNPDLFAAESIMRMVGHWQTLLADASENPEKHIADLAILTEAEHRQILIEWNDREKDYPKDICLHKIIEDQVERTPDATAVVYEQNRLSYRELNERSNQLAHHLRKLGVGPEVLIGISMERSIEMIVGLLGILKAGGAYLPFDVEYPKDRLRMMLDDSRVPILLTQQHLLNRLPALTAQSICLDTGWDEFARESTTNPSPTTDPHNVAYAIYTSGSTGKPKGVLNIHAAIVNRLLWMQDAYRLTSQDRVLQKTPYSFDVSVWEFFWPLMTGACLVMARPGGHKDPDYLVNLIQNEKVTTLHFVPSMLQVFLDASGVDACSSLKRVICSGEALPWEVQKRFFTRLRAELHNLYGPTEAAVDVTSWQCQPEREHSTVPIGRPIANVKIYLLDRNLKPVPVGVAGELHIGGVALARGYLNRPDLTAQRFISDPFSSEAADRLYKTGDLARYRSDGNIEFLGRIDDQVKIHGIRIELGEIEAVLHDHQAVREARVVVREDTPGARRLVAYVVLAEQSASSLSEIRDYLKEELPSYMIPILVSLEKLPMTANGKLDRRALPPPECAETEEAFEPPHDPVEQMLAEVWTEVLGLETVSVYDNFLDLGGDSLSAVQVVTRLQGRLGVRIRVNELAFQSLGQLAASCTERLQCQ